MVLADADKVEAKLLGKDEMVSVAADASAPLAAQVFKTLSEAHLGEFSLLRVFSGKIQAGMEVQNTTRQTSEKLGNLSFLVGKERVDAKVVQAGDIVAAVKRGSRASIPIQ